VLLVIVSLNICPILRRMSGRTVKNFTYKRCSIVWQSMCCALWVACA
jgi:hypothetical protein